MSSRSPSWRTRRTRSRVLRACVAPPQAPDKGRTCTDALGACVQASVLLQIGHEFFLQVPGRHAEERPAPFDDDEHGVFEGKGNVYTGEGGSWFASNTPQRVDYMEYCKSRYRCGGLACRFAGCPSRARARARARATYLPGCLPG